MGHSNEPGNPTIHAVDLFCGAGGLTYGLKQAGIRVEAGIDIDPDAEYAYTSNNPGTRFLAWDLAKKPPKDVARLFPNEGLKLLAGCAPCQPFSPLTNGGHGHRAWGLLDRFGRIVDALRPELVTMENVPELATRGKEILNRFQRVLARCGYYADCQVVRCEEYGVPQARKRLVLVASQLGPIALPAAPMSDASEWSTVRSAISKLPRLQHGQEDANDRLHVAVKLTPRNLRRMRATPLDGGSWSSWPDELKLACHKKPSGGRYSSNYGRMWWDKPAPTMTTLCTGIGNGRFGHPEQDRAITLREAALLQSFPSNYEFWPSAKRLHRSAVARFIGNAVPPMLAQAIGNELWSHVAARSGSGRGAE